MSRILASQSARSSVVLRLATAYSLLPLAATIPSGAAPVEAQAPVPSVSVSFGVDTTATDVGDIVRLVRAYLSRPDTSAVTRGLWATIDPLDRRAGDLHIAFAYQGFPATVLGVMSAGPGDSVYVVKKIAPTVSISATR